MATPQPQQQQMPQGQPTPQQMMAFQLEQQKQMNLQRAASLPSMDDQPINILDITVSYENHAILTKDLPTYQHTWNSSANHDPSPEELCVKINALAGLFRHAPDGAIPPPPNNVDKKRSEQVGRMKEEGNVKFKAKAYRESLALYSMALKIASERMPWEAQALTRDEMSVVLCNRSAAFAALNDWPSSYADADAVTRLKKPWSKGHFRKGKALLGLGRPHDAKEAVRFGLEYDPGSKELLDFVAEIDRAIEAAGSAGADTTARPAPEETA